MLECDGAIINTASTFEKPAIEAFQEWFGERPVISAGPFGFPLVDKEDKEKEKDTPLDLQEQKIRSFLDSALEKYGSHSVLYVSSLKNESIVRIKYFVPDIIREYILVY